MVRTLVVGAGVAGLTLAGELCREGRPPVIIERSGPGSAAAGYAIGLYPLGSCVLHGLGAYRQLASRSLVAERYVLASGTGRVLQAVDMSVLTSAAGPLLMVSRDLVDLLEASCREADLRRAVTIKALAQDQAESRQLARVMFVRHRPVAWARDQLVRRYPAGRALGQIIESVRQPF